MATSEQTWQDGWTDRWRRGAALAHKVFAKSISKAGDLLFPKGLYARALIIIIAPIVLLEGVVAFAFMERHWQAVTRRLSEATARDIAAIVDLYKGYKGNDQYASLKNLSDRHLNITLQLLPAGDLPPLKPSPFFNLLDKTLSKEIKKRITVPFWIDTVGDSKFVEVKVQLENAILSFKARRSQTYASNSHIFLIWMVVTSIILLTVAILFLRNQIRPVLRLAQAADNFGKGRPMPQDLSPRGALEVRQATTAFMEMRDRIMQHVDQRTAMLAGVSHDLRTILTRFKLELAMHEGSPEFTAMQQDVNEMQSMLEDYMAFAEGDGGEEASPTPLRQLLEQIADEARSQNIPVTFKHSRRRKEFIVPLKTMAFKRTLTNLISNAHRFATQIVVRFSKTKKEIVVVVEDNGPGIPEDERDNVFRPFYRLDHARNQSSGNSGLGLAIARDLARSHGGDIELSESKLGGLQATIRLPL